VLLFAVVRGIEVIGEAATKVSAQLRDLEASGSFTSLACGSFPTAFDAMSPFKADRDG
jgi:hypothetical protein